MVKICWDQEKWAGLSLFHESPGAGANWPGRGRTRVSNVCSCPFPLSILARIVPAVMMTSGVGILRAKSRKPQNLTLGNWEKHMGEICSSSSSKIKGWIAAKRVPPSNSAFLKEQSGEGSLDFAVLWWVAAETRCLHASGFSTLGAFILYRVSS